MSSAAAADRWLGSIIGGRYEVVRKIARGGMGTIYEVRNTGLGRSFALKTLSRDAADDPEMLARFRREAEVVAKLRHPNIVEVVDWDTDDDGMPYLVMEYLRGHSLAARLDGEGASPWSLIAEIGDRVLAALTVAHRAGVVHRDLKPDNIFLAHDDEGHRHVKLLDFGISKLRDSHTVATTDARLLGTPAYMAPEQAEGRIDAIGPATDVWSLGAILYEMATGNAAFAGPSTPAILYQVCHGELTPLRELRPDAPPAFVALVERMLTHDDRPASAAELRGELRAALRDVEGVETVVLPTPVEPGPPARPVAQPRRWPVVAGALVAVATVAAIAWIAMTREPEPVTAAISVAPVPIEPSAAPILVETPMPPPATVRIAIDSTPAGATIYRMPAMLHVGTTPWSGELPRADGAADFVVQRPGFAPATLSIDLRTGGTFAPKLTRARSRKLPLPLPPIPRPKGSPVNPFGP